MERNIENFNKLIDAVENGIKHRDKPMFFDMETWFENLEEGEGGVSSDDGDKIFELNDCGTVGCIHGHASILFSEELNRGEVNPKYVHLNDVAGLLGVEQKVYRQLCVPPELISEGYVVTRRHAVLALKHLRDHGTIDQSTWEEIVVAETKIKLALSQKEIDDVRDYIDNGLKELMSPDPDVSHNQRLRTLCGMIVDTLRDELNDEIWALEKAGFIKIIQSEEDAK